MSEEKYIEAIFPIKCCGRDRFRQEVLSKDRAIDVLVRVYQHHGINTSFSSMVTCPHIAGSHSHRCTASHPGEDKVGNGVICPFAFDLPHAIDCANYSDG